MYTDTQLQELVKTVEKEFAAHLAKAEGETQPLNQTEQVAQGAVTETPTETATEPMNKNENGDCDYDDEDKEHMSKIYRSMKKGELAAHLDSIQKAMAEKNSLAKADGNGGETSANPPKDSPGAKSEDSKAATEITKTETGKIESNEPSGSPGPKSEASKAEGVQMEKSEAELLKSELAAQKAKNEELSKQMDGVTQFLTKFVEKTAAPAQKAITSIEVIAKSEGGTGETKELSKSEVTTILAKKAADPTLSKSDREAINSFYLNGASFETISHLLK